VGIDVAAAPATEKPATAAERAAAQRLGSVYRYLDDRAFPIGKWALPETTPGPANKNAFLDVALGEVYGSHQKLDPQWRPSFSRYEHYRRDYAKIINPRLEGAIWNWAQAALEAEALALGGLLIRIEHDPLVPQRLHTLAQAVGKAAGGFHPTHEDITSSYVVSSRGDFPQLVPDLAKLQRALRQRIGPAVRQQKDDLLSTLFVHPLGVEILRHYADDQYRATRYAAGLVNDAQSSVWDFRAELAARGNEAHVWRYPTLVVGGVTALGCHNIPGFSEYAVAIGQVLGQSTVEHFVGFASMAICCLTLVFSGPLGLVVLGAADLALAGTAAGLAYLRENEQELGAEGSAFRRESDQFATSSEYSETLLAGAAALISGIVFFKAVKEFRALVRVKPKSINEVLITRSKAAPWPRDARAAPTDPTARLNRKISGRALDPPVGDARALDRGAVWEEMKTVARGGEGRLEAAPAPEVSKSVEARAFKRTEVTQKERIGQKLPHPDKGAPDLATERAVDNRLSLGQQDPVGHRLTASGKLTGSVRPRPQAALPGPAEHFPFGSGRESLPVPDAPNRLYRIMSMEEAALSLRSKKIAPGIHGAMGSKFFSLKQDYAMLFREKALATVDKLGKRTLAQEAKLEGLQQLIVDLDASGKTAQAAKLRASASRLQAQIRRDTAARLAQADTLVKDWYHAPGQKVLVEVELKPGALEDMLNRAVPEPLIKQYTNRDVFIWKFERGYGDNLAVPPWQLEQFNSNILSINFYAERGVGLFGPRQLPDVQ
jgi:hypothetical protein